MLVVDGFQQVRDLALRVYGFRLEPRTGPRAPR